MRYYSLILNTSVAEIKENARVNLREYRWRSSLDEKNDTLEGLWKELSDYVGGDSSTLVVRDGSDSMQTTIGCARVTVLDVSTALAIYFAEHCRTIISTFLCSFFVRSDILTSCAKQLQRSS